MQTKINHIHVELTGQLAQAKSVKQVEEIRLAFLGKKGSITGLLGQMKELSLEEKKEHGPALQQLRLSAEAAINERRDFLQNEAAANELEKMLSFDVSIDKSKAPVGHMHPYSLFIEEIQNIFLSMGYEIWDGPEIETDFNNFEALNIPADHPARDMYDTFWTTTPGMLLRTHTSTVQVRTMKDRTPPFAGIAPGRTYRHEAVDASHDFQFMQCEGLFVAKGVTTGNLFATAETFLKALFKKETLDIRIRPGFFPFVEPGFEIDMRCVFCKNGCSVCKHSTWIEVFPGGMVHPHVLRAGGIDPEVYTAFAFGFGLTRLAMLKYGIDDIRLLYSGKVKFLEQF